MTYFPWLDTFPGAVTICDREGVILAMNQAALRVFEADGGARLIGSNLFDCHPEPARAKLQHLIETQGTNVYTIEKQGVKKLIYQAPWYDDTGAFGGLIELSLAIPWEMPHFVRD